MKDRTLKKLDGTLPSPEQERSGDGEHFAKPSNSIVRVLVWDSSEPVWHKDE